MKRFVYDQFLEWKNSKARKPLIVRGARQVGKTWLLKEFGSREYENMVYVNFEDEPQFKDLFVNDFDVDRIKNVLQIFSGNEIIPQKTLIVFDEIQAVERGVSALKYFNEKAPDLHIAAAGSLLGISIHKGDSFPVGQVNFIDVFPLSFGEFLLANSENELLVALQEENWSTISFFSNKLIDYLRQYYFVGGMPGVVDGFSRNKDYKLARKLQREILISYENDFSKHAPAKDLPRLRLIWQSIAGQLSRENKKFIFASLKTGARAKDFETALQWLIDCGLVIKCYRISKPFLPLSAYADFSAFKLFLLDVGLLGALAGLDAKTLIDGDRLFVEFKGALAEQYVFQQIVRKSPSFISYWTNDRNSSEVDFVIQIDGQVIPIEVKAGINLKSKSFNFFCQKYLPTRAIRASLADYKKEEYFENIPLYALFV